VSSLRKEALGKSQYWLLRSRASGGVHANGERLQRISVQGVSAEVIGEVSDLPDRINRWDWHSNLGHHKRCCRDNFDHDNHPSVLGGSLLFL
jgi:hypothetical protein